MIGAWETLALTFVVFVGIGVLASAFLWVPALFLLVSEWAASVRRDRHIRLREKYRALVASTDRQTAYEDDLDRLYAGWVGKFEYHRIWLETNK